VAQISWRLPDELAQRVRRLAERQGISVNALISRVLDAATNPALAGTEAERIRERLDRAGLLAAEHASRAGGKPQPDARTLSEARRAAGTGTALAELVGHERG
jgi:predicted transcriptional regulator